MTHTKQAKKSLKKRNGLQASAEERPLKNRTSEEATAVQKQQGIVPVKMSKDSRASSASRRQEPGELRVSRGNSISCAMELTMD